jgi:putative acyl-CoA dehydrogenase
MVTLTRLDCAVASAGLMRLALAEAVHHTRNRKAFGLPLVDQPLMTRVLADMALDAVAAAALAFRLAESYDRAADDPAEAAFARLMTPAVKYWVTKVAPAMIARRWSALAATAVGEPVAAALSRGADHSSLEGPATSCLDVCVAQSSGAARSRARQSRTPWRHREVDAECAAPTATAVALAGEGAARILTEQLPMTVAAALAGGSRGCRRRLRNAPRPYARPGMLDSRRRPAFVNYLPVD